MTQDNSTAEQDTIAQLRQGNIQGLETLVRKYQTQAIRAAYMVTHDLPLAEEIVQEAFLHIYSRIQQFDHHRSFAPWFLRIVVNKAITASKRHSKSLLFSDLGGDGNILPEDVLYDVLPSPEEQLSARLLKERVWQALEKLPPKQRAVIVLRYYLDMNENEMANDLNVPPGTIKWRLHAAKQRLKFLLNIATDTR